MNDRVGRQLGNYKLTRLLGRGGFAEVYLGEHTYLKTLAAIKLLQTKVTNDDDLASFLKEAQNVAHLVHPHIVRILDFGVDGDTPFLVMDYAPHGTLRQRHPRGTQLPLITIVSYVKQVAEALQYAHDEKLIHRDLKPENILLGRRNEVLLSDFGIALIAQSSRYQSTQDVVGTVAYMAPEQIQGKPRTASDQYSLAIVAYEWICGNRPFHGSFTELCTQHMFASPPPLRDIISTISPAVEQVITIALAKDPKQRFASVQAFAKALEQACLEESIPTIISSPGDVSPLHDAPTQTSAWPLAQSLPHLPPTIQAAPSRPSLAAEKLTLLRTLTGHKDIVYDVAISADGETLVSGSRDKTIKLWDLSTGEAVQTFTVHRGAVGSVAVSADGQTLLSGSMDKTIKLWSLSTDKAVRTFTGHKDTVMSIAISEDGRILASGSADKTVRVWDLSTNQAIYTFTDHRGAVSSIAISADGSVLASGSVDKTIKVWNLSTGSKIGTLTDHKDAVMAVAISADGQTLASASADKTIKMWNLSTGQPLRTLTGHRDTVMSVAISADKQILVSGSMDKTMRVWDLPTGKVMRTFTGHTGSVLSVAISADERTLVSGSADGTIKIWRA